MASLSALSQILRDLPLLTQKLGLALGYEAHSWVTSCPSAPCPNSVNTCTKVLNLEHKPSGALEHQLAAGVRRFGLKLMLHVKYTLEKLCCSQTLAKDYYTHISQGFGQNTWFSSACSAPKMFPTLPLYVAESFQTKGSAM